MRKLPWDLIPSEPLELYSAFCDFLVSDSLVVGTLPPEAARWDWVSRREAYRLAAKGAASALGRAEAVLRPQASTLALRAAAAAQEIVVSRLEAWALAPATVSDATVVSLMREQRQRERNAAVALVLSPLSHAAAAAALDSATEEELQTLERAEAIVVKYRKP